MVAILICFEVEYFPLMAYKKRLYVTTFKSLQLKIFSNYVAIAVELI